jgi:hypothetical protein
MLKHRSHPEFTCAELVSVFQDLLNNQETLKPVQGDGL